MKIQIFSDLHANVRPPRHIEVAPAVDAVVVAGDTCEGAEQSFARLRRQALPGQQNDADHIEAWEQEKERELLDFLLLTLAKHKAETAHPPARSRAPRRSATGAIL